MPSQNIIGPNLKKARLEKHVTQDELAIRLQVLGWDIERFGVSKIERGVRQVTDKEVILLAKALEVSVNQLLMNESNG